MPTILRGIKNIFRNKFRNILIILVLALCLSLALMMFNMDFSLNNINKSVKRKIGTRFDVHVNYEYIEKLAKERGKKIYDDPSFFLIDEALADEISSLDSVEKVSKFMYGEFKSEKLKSYEAEMRVKGEGTVVVEEKVIGEEGEEIDYSKMFYAMGIDDADMIHEFQEGTINLVEGNLFKRTDIKQNVALIEKKFAERNRLKLNSEFIINNEKIEVCGIYEVKKIEQPIEYGGYFGEETIYIPFKTAQRFLKREKVDMKGKADMLTVKVDSLDNVQKTINHINNKLSDGKIKASQEMTKYSQILESTRSIKKISTVSMISAFAVAILVILSIMFVTVRARAKEIGILKSIGASNINISAQFLVESISLCVIALILSSIVILAANKPVSDFIVGRGLGRQDYGQMWLPEGFETVKEKGEGYELETAEMMGPGYVELINLKIAFSPQILIFAVLLTFLIGAIGSLIPAFYISKLRPAEVLRFG